MAVLPSPGSTPQKQRNEIGYASKGRMCEARKVHVALSGVRAPYTRERRKGAEDPPDQRNLPKGDLDCIATWRRE